MPFCNNCGTEYPAGGSFCSKCGSKVGAQVASDGGADVSSLAHPEEKTLWEGKPAGLSARVKDQASINSTTYVVTSQRIIIKTGLIGKKEEDIDLHRIRDVKMIQSLGDRALGIGDIELFLVDPPNKKKPSILLEEVKSPNDVKEIIRGAMVAEKTSQRIKEVHKQVIKEVVKVPCKYCGILIESTSTKCSGCGAPLKPF